LKDNNNNSVESSAVAASNDDHVIDIDVSSLPTLPKHDFSSQDFITLLEGHAKTYLQKIKLTITATNSLLLPILFANGIAIFFQAQKEVEDDLNSNEHYFMVSDKIKQALSYDIGTANAEASALTTTMVLSAITIIALSLPYHIKKYYSIHHEVHDLIQALDIKSFKDSMRIKMLSIPREQLIELNKTILREGRTTECLKALERELSFYEKLDWYSEEVGRYIDPLTLLSAIPGFIIMYMATNDFKDGWECETSPFWSYFSDTCKVLQQYSAMSAITYLWDTVSVVWLSLHSLATIARVLSIPFEKFREFIYKYHAPIEAWSKDKERWLYKDLISEFISRLLLFAAVYSVYRAIHLMNRFSLETQCEKFPDFFATLNDASDLDCMVAEKSMTVSGVIVILEFLTFYPLYVASKSLSTLTWLIAEKCFTHPLLSRETARKLLDKFQNINSKNAAIAMLGCFMVGLPAFLMSRTFVNNLMAEGIVENIHMDDGGVYTEVAHKPCPSYGAISLYLANFLHLHVDCDPAFWRRGITVFTAPFWLTVSVTTAGLYVASETVLMTKWLLEEIVKYCKRAKQSDIILHSAQSQHTFFSSRNISRNELKISLNENDNDKQTPLLENDDSPDDKVSSYGCLARIINRFFKTPQLAAEKTLVSQHGYQRSCS